MESTIVFESKPRSVVEGVTAMETVVEEDEEMSNVSDDLKLSISAPTAAAATMQLADDPSKTCQSDTKPNLRSRSGADAKTPGLDKYNLRTRSIQNRIETEKRKKEPRKPKPKQRPPPLSKYRRKTANLRERCRMQVSEWRREEERRDRKVFNCELWLQHLDTI